MTRGVFTGGVDLPASELNDCFDMPRCRVRWAGAAQSMTTAVSLAVAFDTETYDVGGCHSNVTNNSRITCPSGGDGLWVIGGELEIAANATGQRDISILVNGTTIIATDRCVPSASFAARLDVQTEYRLAAGDYVQLFAYQNSGGALNITTGAEYSPIFYARWVAI